MAAFERHPSEAELMKRILEVRLTNLEEEKALCKELLGIAEAERSTYVFAFANLYLADSLLALGEYEDCDFYLIRANYLCREHDYDDLLAILCNLAGLYYQSINDSQMALQYYLEGLALSRKVGDYALESKLLNNIGRVFSWCEDAEMAQKYVQAAYGVIEHRLDEETIGIAISCLSNLANLCLSRGDKKGAEDTLVLCEKLGGDELYHCLRLACEWCNFYAVFHEHEQYEHAFDNLVDLGFFEFEDKLFVFDMAIELLESLISLGDKARTEWMLDFLDGLSEEVPLGSRHALQVLRVRYCEFFGERGLVDDEYRKYYELTCEVHKMDDSMRVQSMKSQIHLKDIMEDRERMYEENRELEKASQLDGLTGLYNRRYFNKLISKFTGSEKVKSLGFILVDVDYFKQYNDLYGHFAGDDALKAVASVLVDNAGEGIHVARYGGDEFVCLCVDRADDEVAAYVSAVLGGLLEHAIVHQDSPAGGVLTLSIGWCNEPTDLGATADVLMHLADDALYEVKERGRNGQWRKRLDPAEWPPPPPRISDMSNPPA